MPERTELDASVFNSPLQSLEVLEGEEYGRAGGAELVLRLVRSPLDLVIWGVLLGLTRQVTLAVNRLILLDRLVGESATWVEVVLFGRGCRSGEQKSNRQRGQVLIASIEPIHRLQSYNWHAPV